MISELLLAALPAVGLLAMVALAVGVWVAAYAVVPPPVRTRTVGGRAHEHRMLLVALPAASHPDARGHSRPRAPGAFPGSA